MLKCQIGENFLGGGRAPGSDRSEDGSLYRDNREGRKFYCLFSLYSSHFNKLNDGVPEGISTFLDSFRATTTLTTRPAMPPVQPRLCLCEVRSVRTLLMKFLLWDSGVVAWMRTVNC